jgi:hypothetical protein
MKLKKKQGEATWRCSASCTIGIRMAKYPATHLSPELGSCSELLANIATFVENNCSADTSILIVSSRI